MRPRTRPPGAIAETTPFAETQVATVPSMRLPRVVKESSDSGVELEQAAESVATADGTALGTWRYAWRREEDKVALTLVVPFKMMMIDVFGQRPA